MRDILKTWARCSCGAVPGTASPRATHRRTGGDSVEQLEDRVEIEIAPTQRPEYGAEEPVSIVFDLKNPVDPTGLVAVKVGTAVLTPADFSVEVSEGHA